MLMFITQVMLLLRSRDLGLPILYSESFYHYLSLLSKAFQTVFSLFLQMTRSFQCSVPQPMCQSKDRHHTLEDDFQSHLKSFGVKQIFLANVWQQLFAIFSTLKMTFYQPSILLINSYKSDFLVYPQGTQALNFSQVFIEKLFVVFCSVSRYKKCFPNTVFCQFFSYNAKIDQF